MVFYAQGRFAELSRQFPGSYFDDCAKLAQGAYQQITSPDAQHAALVAQGRYAELLASAPASPWCTMARYCQGIDAARDGDAARAHQLLSGPLFMDAQDDQVLDQLFLVPFVYECLGEHGALSHATAQAIAGSRYSFYQRPWYLARLLSGGIDGAAFLAQPYHFQNAGNLPLYLALREDLAGQTSAASAHYRAFLATPMQQRTIGVDPFRDRLAQWRLAVIAH
jgi:hypothetical protein